MESAYAPGDNVRSIIPGFLDEGTVIDMLPGGYVLILWNDNTTTHEHIRYIVPVPTSGTSKEGQEPK